MVTELADEHHHDWAFGRAGRQPSVAAPWERVAIIRRPETPTRPESPDRDTPARGGTHPTVPIREEAVEGPGLQPGEHVLDHGRPRQLPNGGTDWAFDERTIERGLRLWDRGRQPDDSIPRSRATFRLSNPQALRPSSPHTSSSTASSALSMMKRNRADASLPINSLITRSVTS